MPISSIIVLGGGMCGVASAIALARAFPPASGTQSVKITLYELRSAPSAIGGAVNLTPSALRCLDILGVLDELQRRKAGCEVDRIQMFSLHTGASMGTMDFAGPDGQGYDGYRGLRIMRADLLLAMLDVASKLDQLELVYNKKVVALDEAADYVVVKFHDGTTATGELVLGCDGIHSATRMRFLEPDRVPIYSGISATYGFTKKDNIIDPSDKLFFEDTSLCMSRCGALLTTHCTAARESIYVASIMEKKEQVDKDGWRALGQDQKAVKEDMLKRFGVSALPRLREIVEGVNEWYLFPVFVLSPNGKWTSKRVILLGDAAHAMPPRGESIGYAFEDAIKFAHILQHYGLEEDISRSFSLYEHVRRKPINDAYKDASMGWDTNKDSGWLLTKFMEFLTPVYLWWTANTRARHYMADPRDIEFSSTA